MKSKLTEHNATLREMVCTPNGLDLTLEVRKLGASFTYKALLVVEEFGLTPRKHEARVRIKGDNLEGSGIWSTIVLMIINLLVKDIVGKALEHSEEIELENDESGKIARVDLRSIQHVDKLYIESSIPFLNKRPIDLLSIDRLEHETNGVRLFLASNLVENSS